MSIFFKGNSEDFIFWTPQEGDVVLVGPEQSAVSLPQRPLPVYPHACKDGCRPDDNLLGEGIYEYLRRYPDSEEGYYLAELLKNAYPHYLSDIASQIVMIEEKDVDAPFIRRKITGLKILALIDVNPQLLYQIGRNYFDLTTIFTELPNSRSHLMAAREYLQRSLALFSDNPAALNLLAQINLWFGMTDEAARLWQSAATLLEEPTSSRLLERVDGLQSSASGVAPLIDELEQLGVAMSLLGEGDLFQAQQILERLQESGRIMQEWPAPEFPYLLGHCRELLNDSSGAIVAYLQALQLDPEFSAAKEGFDRVSQGRV